MEQEPLINVIDPDTQEVGSLPQSQAQEALTQGYAKATPEDVSTYLKHQKFSTPGQQALTAVEGLGTGVAGPLFTGAEKLLGAEGENITGRREENPNLHTGFQAAGLLGSTLTGVGEGAVLAKVGEAAAAGIQGTSGLAKIGSMAVRGAAETGLFQAGDEVSKMIADPSLSPDAVETAALNVGLSTLMGGAITGGLGAISPLWKATAGPKVGMFLKALSDKAGGIEGQLPDEIQNSLHAAGVDIAPEVRAGFSKDPQTQDLFKLLQESPTSSGIEAQESLKKFKLNANKALVESLGKTPEDVAGLSELSPHDEGKKIQDTLHNELKEQVAPVTDLYKEIEGRFKNVNIGEPAKDRIAQDIGMMIQEKGYYLSPSAPQAQLINKTLDEISGIQTLDDIKKYVSIVNDKTQTPEMWKVGGDLRRIFRQAESDILHDTVGKKAPELLRAHTMGRETYKDLMETIDSLNDRLHVGRYGGPDSFLKALKEMSPEDVLRRLSGKGDVDALNLLKERFPAVADAVKDYHVNSALKAASAKSTADEIVNPKVLFNSLDKMDPKFLEFAFPEASRFSVSNRFNSVRSLLDALPEKMNTSGTAKTLDALWSKIPGSGVAIASMLTGHNPALGFLLGGLGKWVSRDIPDAIKLATLKFLGSGQPIDSAGFKSMVDFIHHTMQGNNLLSKTAKALFQSGRDVLPSSVIPSDKDKSKLDKMLKNYQDNPKGLMDVGGSTGHYLPEHGAAIGQYTANATNYLNAQRPQIQKGAPLDKAIEPSEPEKAQYDRTLEIAEQPLTVLQHIKDGTLTSKDVQDFSVLNPSLHQKLIGKLTEEMNDHLTGENEIPYHVRQGLSLLMGQPLDSTMTPEGIQLAQGSFQTIKPSDIQNAQMTRKPAQNSFKHLAANERTPLDRRMSRKD